MKKIFAIFIGLFFTSTVWAAPVLDVLNDTDAQTYQQIFMLQDKEKIDSAKKLEAKIKDKILMNEVLYQRFFSRTYRTRALEMTNWMNCCLPASRTGISTGRRKRSAPGKKKTRSGHLRAGWKRRES